MESFDEPHQECPAFEREISIDIGKETIQKEWNGIVYVANLKQCAELFISRVRGPKWSQK